MTIAMKKLTTIEEMTTEGGGTRRTVRLTMRAFLDDAVSQPKRVEVRPSLQYVWGGVDLHAELHRLAALCPEDVQVRPPSLVLHKVGARRRTVGLADRVQWAIHVWLWPELPLGAVLATLVHELAHFCAPTDLRHGEHFRTAMLELARDAYGVVVAWEPESEQTSHLDFLVEHALCWHVDAWWKSRQRWPLLNERCAVLDEEAPCKG